MDGRWISARTLAVLTLVALAVAAVPAPASAQVTGPLVDVHISVQDGGVAVDGAFVNATNFRTGWRANATSFVHQTTGEVMYQVSLPLYAPSSPPISVGDEITVTASKGGKVGVQKLQITAATSGPTINVTVALGPNPANAGVEITSLELGEDYIDVAWNACADDDFAKYVVYLSRSKDSYGVALQDEYNVQATTCRLTGIDEGVRYYVRVCVIDAAGYSDFSAQRSVGGSVDFPVAWALAVLAVVVAAVLVAYLLMRRRHGSGGVRQAAAKRRRRR